MGKTKREASQRDSFHKHYASIWGEERWSQSLYPALTLPTHHSALVNRAIPLNDAHNVLRAPEIEAKPPQDVALPGTGGAICVARLIEDPLDEIVPLPQPTLLASRSTVTSLMSHWNMDAASVLAARLLGASPGERVLDLCAAPGGKSFALAQDLFFCDSTTNANSKSQLFSNEADKTRYRRLAENMKAYLPGSLNVKSTNIDATSPNAHRELAVAGGWEKVLVDAPCSSERHIIHAHLKAQASGRVAPEMANWRPGSTKRLQETQFKLLMTALRLVKDHGCVLYATCSIEPGENDGVIEKILAQVEKEGKKGLISWSVKIGGFPGTADDGSLEAQLESTWAERTKYGWISLPDHAGGGRWGPLFFAVLTKEAAG